MKRMDERVIDAGGSILWGRILLTVVSLAWFGVLVLFPVAGIFREVLRGGPGLFFSSLATPEAGNAFLLTVWITVGTVIVNTVFGVLLALVLVKQRFRGKLILEGLVDLPFAVSPVVAGFMLIILFGPNGWIGSWFEAQGVKIIYAFPGMMLATLFVTLPFVAREVIPVLREVGLDQEEAALILGASRWQAFWRVTLPSIQWGLIYGVTLTIARSVGEFGAVLVVSGSIIRRTQTATLHIHQEFTDFHYAGAFSAAIVLALTSLIILIVMQRVMRRKGAV